VAPSWEVVNCDGLKCLTLKCYISGYDMYNRVHSSDLVQWRLK
jgi:hypothetical protein